MKHIKLYEDFINEAERVPTQLQPSDFRKYFSDIHYDTVKRQYDRDTTPEIAQANNGKWYEVSSAYNRWDERIVKLKSVKAPKNEANESTELDEALNEISLSSAGVRSFLRAMYTNADVIKKLGFNSFKDLVSYVKSNDLRDWDELRAEVEELGIVIAESEDCGYGEVLSWMANPILGDEELLAKLDERCSSRGPHQQMQDKSTYIPRELGRAYMLVRDQRNDSSGSLSFSGFVSEQDVEANWEGLSNLSILKRLLVIAPEDSETHLKKISKLLEGAFD